MSWQTWYQIHAETIFNQTSPVIISRNPNQVDVFKIGFDNAVWTTFWNPDNGWNDWFQIHPETVFDNQNGHITAVLRNPDQIDLFTTGFDNVVWTTFWNPANGWNAWFQIHPETVFNQRTPVTVISRNPNQIDLFKIGFDGAVWTTFWNPANGWNAWFQIHPERKFDVNGTVSAISRNPDQIDLFVTGFDGAVWTTLWNTANGWNAWFQIHPETVFNQQAPITVISRNPEELDLFKIGFDGAVWTTFWNPANSWNAWFQIHPETKFDASGVVTAITRNPNQIDLFTTGFDSAVWSTFWNPSNGWNGWFNIHPETVFNHLTSVSCSARTPDHIDLFRIGFDNVLWSTWWDLDNSTYKRGLLASPQLDGQAVKGLYFFPGERGGNYPLYTAHPLDIRDEQWNNVPATRTWVTDRMINANVNTIVMSYWGDIFGSPMDVGPDTLQGVLEAVQGKPIVIMPALESGVPPQWEFMSDFPVNPIGSSGLINRIGELVELFSGKMDLWAKMYDRDGNPRYAVNIIHAASKLINTNDPFSDETFASGFEQVAQEVTARYNILVGFTLDTIGNQVYSAFPLKAGPILEKTASVLAIQGFASEVFSPPGTIKNGASCTGDWHFCNAFDNNIDNLENIVNWKHNALADWLQIGIPIILDVSNGFDGRIVWAAGGTGFWGDNFMYTDDRWRNWLSELKQPGIKGITFNTWNGYTEGYAAVPTHEHGSTVYNWLTDLFAPLPWDYSHMHYVNGAATHRVYGAICEKWLSLGGDRGFGAPMSDELPAGIGRKQHFEDEKTIYWSPDTSAHELHGIIRKTYISYDAEASGLGFPVSDEEATGSGSVNYFQYGRIDWVPGEIIGSITFY